MHTFRTKFEETPMSRLRILDQIDQEREAQDRKFKAGSYIYRLPDPGTPDEWKASVLMEEVGEAAHEVNELINAQSGQDIADRLVKLRTELIQVAAVAVAWIESLDAE